jgi:hypothetical protein
VGCSYMGWGFGALGGLCVRVVGFLVGLDGVVLASAVA